MNVIVQTRTSLSHIPRQHPAAVPDLKGLIHQLQGTPHRSCTGKRSEIPGLVLLHLPRQKDPRIRLLHRHLDVRIGLIVPQHRIVARSIFLDEIIFQDQRLQLRVRHNILKAMDNLYSNP